MDRSDLSLASWLVASVAVLGWGLVDPRGGGPAAVLIGLGMGVSCAAPLFGRHLRGAQWAQLILPAFLVGFGVAVAASGLPGAPFARAESWSDAVPVLVTGLLVVALGVGLLVRSQTSPPLGDALLSADKIRELLSDGSAPPLMTAAVVRVDRLFTSARPDAGLMTRVLPDGTDVRGRTSPPPSLRQRLLTDVPPPRPPAVHRYFLGRAGGSSCLVVLRWDGRPGLELEASAYAWAKAGRPRCEAALDVVGSRLGADWRTGPTTEITERWWLLHRLRGVDRGGAHPGRGSGPLPEDVGALGVLRTVSGVVLVLVGAVWGAVAWLLARTVADPSWQRVWITAVGGLGVFCSTWGLWLVVRGCRGARR